jgi:hypothetical protein
MNPLFSKHPSAVAAISLALVTLPTMAQAQPEQAVYRVEPSAYPIEIEPHFSFGPDNVYGSSGIGAGLRVSIPVVASLLVRVPDNLAISFGGDLIHYDNCYFGDECGANYLMLPIAAQWNIFVARRVSLFAEAGAFVYKGFFNECGPGDGPECSSPSDFGVLPTLAVGARIHLGDNAAFTARLGYPTMTLGISFL